MNTEYTKRRKQETRNGMMHTQSNAKRTSQGTNQMTEDFTAKQYTYWDGECKKYQKLFIQNSFKDITEEEKNLYSYAMWYCQEQRAKYR